jgi:hypothetical protein
VVANVVKVRSPGPSRLRICQCDTQEYKRTGFAWEQYSGTTGEGRRSRPYVAVRTAHAGDLSASQIHRLDLARGLECVQSPELCLR